MELRATGGWYPNESPELSQSEAPPDRPGRTRQLERLWRSVGLPLASIALVVTAILVIQRVRSSDDGGGEFQADGAYSQLSLGTTGEGGTRIGDAAPQFQLRTEAGELIRLADLLQTPVVINFWATWCVPCRREIPDLIVLQGEWGATAQIVGVDLQESGADVASFRANYGINYPTPLDSDGEVARAYRLFGLPETFFLDTSGVVRDHRIGLLKADVARCIVAGLKESPDYDPEDCR